MPLLLDALPVRGSAYKTYLSKVATLQNKEVKIITGAKLNDKTLPIIA